jgi:hypothetical protein
VFVRLAEGRTIVVPGCGAETTVESFESAVGERCEGRLADGALALPEGRLAYGAKQLAAGRTLGDYNVQEGSTVEQLLRLRGGGVSVKSQPASRAPCFRSRGLVGAAPLLRRCVLPMAPGQMQRGVSWR